jgi:hypothetical protein
MPLRWLLALVLILNGAVVPPAIAGAAVGDDHHATAQATSGHCHQHDAVPAGSGKHGQKIPCPCCTDGGACQCGCVVALALLRFPDLRPLAPSTPATPAHVPELAAALRHRLLRPPIV